HHPELPSFPTRRSSDLTGSCAGKGTHSKLTDNAPWELRLVLRSSPRGYDKSRQDHRSMTHAQSVSMFSRGWMAGKAALLTLAVRSEEHTSELQSLRHLV